MTTLSPRVILALLTLVLAFCGNSLFGQKRNESFVLQIRKTMTPVTVDGRPDDAAWLGLDAADRFFMVIPMDTSRARTANPGCGILCRCLCLMANA